VKAPDGPLAEVDETRPTLARQAADLRCDQDELLHEVVALREEAQRAADVFEGPVPATRKAGASIPDFGTIRQDGQQLLARLQQARAAEAGLVLESVNTDLGAGD